VTSEKPVSCYEFRERDGLYYSIAAEDAPAFMELAMRASLPLDDTAAQLGFYPLTIAAVTPETPDPKAPDSPVVRFTFTGPVPNGGGVLSTPSGAYELRPDPNRVAGAATKELLAAWRANYEPRDPASLKGGAARFFSADYPPGAKSAAEQSADLLQKVINSVDRLGAGY